MTGLDIILYAYGSLQHVRPSVLDKHSAGVYN